MQKKPHPSIPCIALMLFLLIPQAVGAATLKPGSAIDYKELAFYPKRWEAADISTQLIPWEGEQLVFLTTTSDLDNSVMAQFVDRLNAGWELYTELTGRRPRMGRQWNGKAPIAAIPMGKLTCGYGCGYIGATGIEVSAFYKSDYPLALKDQDTFHHYYFYEMGRNFYTFGDRHSLFITGFAVFMRYVCMDNLNCTDPDAKTRTTIEGCEAVYAESDIPFLAAFTNLSSGEKGQRLKNKAGRPIIPSDQPVMYACAMLKLYRDYGGNDWLKRFFRHLAKCPTVKAKNGQQALTQCLSWLVCASAAASKDLTPVFVDRWRMPLPAKAHKILSRVSWTDQSIDVVGIIASLKNSIAPDAP
jgi:hypothetical protein